MTVTTVIHAALLCVCNQVMVMVLGQQIEFFFSPMLDPSVHDF